MTPVSVVVDLDVVKHCVGELSAGDPLLPVQQLHLPLRPKGLGERMVIAISNGFD